ncbi:outer membrane protein assembly factor BamE domain-containing protein [Hymenobacter mucosus]|uniref:SmpA / OmlA family protein n=1 Tax=Hymenobacter mucosus TaxID=1411120 RepID=A0A239BMC0_9BACT|nr:outer membrane protein assembly factor BamE [Hymenobacter mucosus]SNS08213.1 SmpA / OmlA family protein [Hymenobacter mucosus]
MVRRRSTTVFFALLIALVSVVVGLVLWVNYDTHLSPAAQASTANGRHIRQVRVGMDTTQVHRLMGPPQDVARFNGPPVEIIYHYQHRPGTSDSYQIKVNAQGKVINVGILEDY